MCEFAGPSITNCVISGNSADEDGGAIRCYAGGPTIADCSIVGNAAGLAGGGVYCASESSLTISNCTIAGNTASNGGGVYCSYSSPRIINCTFSGNAAEFSGGLGANNGNSVLANCMFGGNTAQLGGGIGIFNSRGTCNLTLANCTFGANAAVAGTTLFCDSQDHEYPSSVQIGNCIMWSGGDEICNSDSSAITIAYSDVQGGWPGEGNIDAGPVFADADGPDDDPNTWEDNDYQLSAGSPCIDAGCNWAVPADSADLDDDNDTTEVTPLDLDGEGRFFDDPDTLDTGCGCPPIVDMGAYEFGDAGPLPCPGDLDCDRVVGHSDLGALLGAWEWSNEGDLNCDGVTDQADLGILLTHWGEVCP